MKPKQYDDIFFRNCIISLLDLLNKNITIQQVVDGKTEDHSIPFFYRFDAGAEDFMKDFFLELPHGSCIPSHAEGNFDQSPKGILDINSFTIKTSDITNKFIRGTFTQPDIGPSDARVQKIFSAYLFVLPMYIKFNVEVISDNFNQFFKIIQSVLDTCYKQYVIFFQFRGTRIPGQFQFSDEFEKEKKFKFDYIDDNKIRLKFNIDLECFYPIFDEKTKLSRARRIKEFKLSVNNEETIIDENTVIN